MSLETAFEVGRLLKPLLDIAAQRQDIYNQFMLLPGLRCFWPTSVIDGSGNLIDVSGNGQNLTRTGAPFGALSDKAPYVSLDGTNDYYTRSDSAVLDVLGTETHISASLRGLTVGCWVNFSALGATAMCISKDNPTTDRSWHLKKNSTNQISFVVSGDGSALTSASGGSALNASTWYFFVGRYTASKVDAWVNATLQIANETSIPASIYNSAAALNIGSDHDTNYKLQGLISLCFLCAAAIPDSMISQLYNTSRELFGV